MENLNNEAVTMLCECSNEVEANIIKGVLETNGVQCMITNEIMSSVLPHWALGVGTLRVMVFERDLDLARRILASAPSESLE